MRDAFVWVFVPVLSVGAGAGRDGVDIGVEGVFEMSLLPCFLLMEFVSGASLFRCDEAFQVSRGAGHLCLRLSFACAFLWIGVGVRVGVGWRWRWRRGREWRRTWVGFPPCGCVCRLPR